MRNCKSMYGMERLKFLLLSKVSSEFERFNTNASILEKRARGFDKVIAEWRASPGWTRSC